MAKTKVEKVEPIDPDVQVDLATFVVKVAKLYRDEPLTTLMDVEAATGLSHEQAAQLVDEYLPDGTHRGPGGGGPWSVAPPASAD